MSETDLGGRVAALLEQHPPERTDRLEFLRARFDAGLAWVHFPVGLGGLGLPRAAQDEVDALLAAAGAPDNDPEANGIGLGMAAPTILAFGTSEQQQRYLRPLWTGEEIWCQLFSEPGAGSDLAAVATRAVPEGEHWVVDGQKVWTSIAHQADMAILVARTDPDLPKHDGLTYFLCPMREGGVTVRPLRQITGEAEFNEVFLDGVQVPDANRLGERGQGWKIATFTLNNERIAIGGGAPREGGMIGVAARAYRECPQGRTAATFTDLMRLWVEAEAARVTGIRVRDKLAVGRPGPEAAAAKVSFARIAQQASGLELRIRGADGLRYGAWEMTRPQRADFTGRDAGFRYLRAKGNSIEGGTSEILLNIIAERVLHLPVEARADRDVAWKDLPR